MQEEELKRFQPIDELQFSTQGGHGVLERRPEDSVYYHATLNPTGTSSTLNIGTAGKRHITAFCSKVLCFVMCRASSVSHLHGTWLQVYFAH